MLLYRFLNSEFGLKSISERRLRISRINEVNDPFELLAPDLSNQLIRAAIKATKEHLSERHGLICFSKSWGNPTLWSHYADKHRGICLAFEVEDSLIQKIKYIKSRIPIPRTIDDDFSESLLFTKSLHWKYEEEYRAYMTLQEPEDGHYYADFSNQLELKKVIVGLASEVSKQSIATSLGNIKNSVDVFKATTAFKQFKVIRNLDETLWK